MNNYEKQAMQAKKHFLTYDQKELIARCGLRYDEAFFYIKFLGEDYRICRASGDMERWTAGQWVDGNAFGEVMTILDWLCDSRKDRYITGNWVNIVTQGNYFHRSLQEDETDPDAELFDKDPGSFRSACLALGGKPHPSGDIAYTIELVDGLCVLVQLWHGDEEFPPRLCVLWDENALRYIRYETTWFAVGLLLQRMKEKMKDA